MENKKTGGTGGIVFSVIFLIWFMVSLVGMVYFSKEKNGGMALVIAGQYFLVFGLIAVVSGIKSKTFQPIVLIFPLVGLGMMAGGYVLMVGNQKALAMMEYYLPYLFLGVFFVVGASVVVSATCKHRKRLRDCDYVITATCVEIASRWHKGKRTFCPIYEIYFREQNIRLCSHTYSSANRMEVGERKELHINSENPEEFYEETEEKQFLTIALIIGIMFMGMSGLALFMMLWMQKENGVHTGMELGMQKLLEGTYALCVDGKIGHFLH